MLIRGGPGDLEKGPGDEATLAQVGEDLGGWPAVGRPGERQAEVAERCQQEGELPLVGVGERPAVAAGVSAELGEERGERFGGRVDHHPTVAGEGDVGGTRAVGQGCGSGVPVPATFAVALWAAGRELTDFRWLSCSSILAWTSRRTSAGESGLASV